MYPTLVKLDFLGTLSYLISHDNIVISTDVIKLLYGLVSVCHVDVSMFQQYVRS